ncbi:NSFL1 cofactor p47 [Lingula anatina]|uniref:NSFL1 cofactor p47 n=1 Tax=Lingula anatina TaxID=7574 RepID=A0A1S3JQ44_LINAN|nr:NSFL1 cofactor p47 [Lingula anatina]|eukprot:XP_013412074.1 NSFL1 cofactor p47 [Lingula anatina]
MLCSIDEMADHDSLVSEFSAITGADAERAQFYLEAAGWDLQLAMSSFFESHDDGGDDSDDAGATAEVGAPSAPSKQYASGSGSQFATLSDINKGLNPADNEGQAFYAGGADEGGSGQQILGPPKKKSSEIVEDLFKSAKEHGAEEMAAGSAAAAPAGKTAAFRGRGYKLGEMENEPTNVVGEALQEEPQEIQVVLKLWKNGFSVGDGPLRDYGDPQNKEFLNSIHRGQVPLELIKLAKGGEVDLQMEDHREEEFVAPKVKLKAFSGEGQRLGSAAPTVVTQSSPDVNQQNEAAAVNSVEVDSSLPTTGIQIRLADGGRLLAKFNHTNKISDVRNYILKARPQMEGTQFVLMTTFPNRELTDETQTLADAKLLNAVVVQRMK